MEKEAKLSAIESDILTVLMRGNLYGTYGMDILERLNDGRPSPVNAGSLYPSLNRLREKGLVAWRWGDEENESGGARRKYYKATDQGKNVINRWQVYRARLQLSES